MAWNVNLHLNQHKCFEFRSPASFYIHPSSLMLHPLTAPPSPQTISHPDAAPRSGRPRCGGRKSNFPADIGLAGLLFCAALTTVSSLAAAAEPPGKAAPPEASQSKPRATSAVQSRVIQREWHSHTVQQYHGDTTVDIPATAQVTTTNVSWGHYLVYMREKNRLLMGTAEVGLFSDDLGTTWTETARPPGVLTYLGDGKVLARGALATEIFRSTDYGVTWQSFAPVPLIPGLKVAYGSLSPILVDKDASTGNVVRLAEIGYGVPTTGGRPGYFTFSTDGGLTWLPIKAKPPWTSETDMIRAGNGDIVAATRTSGSAYIPDPKAPYDWCRVGGGQDFYGGLGICISKDNGNTWSPIKKLYEFGRHHPSIVLLPNSDLVMSYVVRLGYGPPLEGLPRYGIEAVVSHDHGQTWNLDRRYILDKWEGEWLDRPGGKVKLMAPNETHTVLLPDGSLITAYVKHFPGARRAVQLVRWRLGK